MLRQDSLMAAILALYQLALGPLKILGHGIERLAEFSELASLHR
jgi:hypothetical protein